METTNVLRFANGYELPVLVVSMSTDYVDNANRRTMIVQTERGAASLDELDALLCDQANLAKFWNENTKDGITEVFEGFYKLDLSAKEMPVDEDKNGNVVKEAQIVFVLAAYTQQELLLQQILANMNAGGGE